MLGPLEALAWGIGVGAVTAFVFALRFGAVAGPVTFLLLRAGIGIRRLTGMATLGVIAIAVLYVSRPAPDYGGFSFYFSLHQILAHLIGAGVICALVAAGLLGAHELRGPRRGRAPSRQTGPDPAPDGGAGSPPARIISRLS